jgi:hypothetical protein
MRGKEFAPGSSSPPLPLSLSWMPPLVCAEEEPEWLLFGITSVPEELSAASLSAQLPQGLPPAPATPGPAPAAKADAAVAG